MISGLTNTVGEICTLMKSTEQKFLKTAHNIYPTTIMTSSISRADTRRYLLLLEKIYRESYSIMQMNNICLNENYVI